MTARRFLNIVQGFIMESLNEDERGSFIAELNGRSADTEKRRSLVLLQGGEIG